MRKIILCIILLLLFNYCSNKPEPINYGHDSCENCRMIISNPNYGAELVTSKGKVYKFDSIECLADFSMSNENNINTTLWVTNFNGNAELINKEVSFFLLSENLRSPMGLNLTAFSSIIELDNMKQQHGGSEIKWKELLGYVKEKWNK
ncbi:MAG: nitrous oxide reductase accessory protein NosL [Ignavibacteriales bacterium]|nr:nitrous oxide reductase accessory protein NosL [Ignavibacteriales bacterium]